jgi:hypothetical protein
MSPKSHEFAYRLVHKLTSYILGAFADGIAAANCFISFKLFPAEQPTDFPDILFEIFTKIFRHV